MPAAPGAGPASLAGELLGRVRAELPAVGGLGEREQVLVSAWLTGLRSSRTRRAYAGDVVAWLGWLTERETDSLAAGRVHVDLWAATQQLVRRLARTAGVGAWEQLSPHSLRHSAITFALDAGASLRDVRDYAGHKDSRTTRRYDIPATAWTATPPTPSLPTWRDSTAGLLT